MPRERLATAGTDRPEGDGAGRSLSSDNNFSLLPVSRRKSAFALQRNLETLLGDHASFRSAVFITLTVGDKTPDGFKQVFDWKEASRRFHKLTRGECPYLSRWFSHAVVVVEKHLSGAIHFHLVGILKGKPDVRSTFNFAAYLEARSLQPGSRSHRKATANYSRTAHPELRRLWASFRAVLPRFGFGRAEAVPLRTNSAAVACYLAKYLGKAAACETLPARVRVIRYLGEWRTITRDNTADGAIWRITPAAFGWGTPGSTRWRNSARWATQLFGGTTPEDARYIFGPRWSSVISRAFNALPFENTPHWHFVIYEHLAKHVYTDLSAVTPLSEAERHREAVLARGWQSVFAFGEDQPVNPWFN